LLCPGDTEFEAKLEAILRAARAAASPEKLWQIVDGLKVNQ